RLVKSLLDAGANPNGAPPDGWPPLMDAVGKPEIMRLLLERGADVEGKGNFPLIRAANFEDARSMALLLDHGAKIDATDDSGRTALINIAESTDSTQLVKLLLARGAAVNARDSNRKTALTYARQRKRRRVVEALLRAGATE